MSNLCIIPARGGSKRLPGKNLMKLAGHPMLAYSLEHARRAKLIDTVVVSTDCEEIADLSRSYGADVVIRPADLSSDEATSESALLHVLDARASDGLADPDFIVFLQCTSPARHVDDIDRAIQTFKELNLDSLFSACETKSLMWRAVNGRVSPINYDWKSRKREQNMDCQYIENGSIFVFPPSLLRETENRLGGRIGTYDMTMLSSFQVDVAEDIELMNWILGRPEFQIDKMGSS